MADQDVNMDDISIQDNTSHHCEDVQEKTAIKRDEAVNSVDKKEITSPSLAEEGSRTEIQSSPNLPVAASNVSLKEDNLLKRNLLEDSEPSIQIDSGKKHAFSYFNYNYLHMDSIIFIHEIIEFIIITPNPSLLSNYECFS